MYFVDDDLEELSLGDDFAFDVGAVEHEDDCVGARVISGPDAADALLAAQVPSAELNVLVRDLLDVAADGRSGLNCLPQGPE